MLKLSLNYLRARILNEWVIRLHPAAEPRYSAGAAFGDPLK